jgi:hypothetical protein
VPLLHVWPAKQTAPWHLPLLQMGVPLGHRLPHPPQLTGSTNGSLHDPPQQFSHDWQAGLHVDEPLELPLPLLPLPLLEAPELLVLPPLEPPLLPPVLELVPPLPDVLPPLLDVLPLALDEPPLLDPPPEPLPLLPSAVPESPEPGMLVDPPHQRSAREKAARPKLGKERVFIAQA